MTIINIQKNDALEALDKINQIAETLEAEKEMLEKSITQTMIDAYKKTYDLFWSNPEAICEEAGNQAYLLFTKHIEAGEAIKARKEDFELLTVPAGWEVQFNQDGTVDLEFTEPVIEPVIEE